MKFRKKPVVIEAIQYKEGEEIAILDWSCQFGATKSYPYISAEGLKIHTLEGVIHVSNGDYVICGIEGEYYPCKPDIFEKTYEKVEE